MSTVELVGSQLSDPGPGDDRKPLIVLGPSIGTSVATLWSECAAHLADRFHVVGWDLPGHGVSPAATASFDLLDVADAVLALVDRVQAERGDPGAPFGYAGDSAGGAVGLQLLLTAPARLGAAVILCSRADFAAMPGWTVRADAVRASGTASLVSGALERWFPPEFPPREPERVSALLHALRDADGSSYAWVCDALATFDVTAQLSAIDVPVLIVAGSADVATPPDTVAPIAGAVRHGRLVVLDGVGHLPPAQSPSVVAKLLAQHLEPRASAPTGIPEQAAAPDALHENGMRVRREVLGPDHVDRAIAGTTALTADFQDFITRYAWGSIWTRPGLDRKQRSIVTLTALVARGHEEELAMHLRAARRNGLTDEEILEVLLQCAVYCGVPEANTAFRVAQRVLAEPRGGDE